MNKQSFRDRIKSFSFGAMAGIFLAIIYWSYSVDFDASLPLINSILGGLFFAVSCGAISAIVGLDRLMEFIEHLP